MCCVGGSRFDLSTYVALLMLFMGLMLFGVLCEAGQMWRVVS